MLDALAEGSLNVDGILTHTLPAARSVDAFATALDASASSKVVISFGEDA